PRRTCSSRPPGSTTRLHASTVFHSVGAPPPTLLPELTPKPRATHDASGCSCGGEWLALPSLSVVRLTRPGANMAATYCNVFALTLRSRPRPGDTRRASDIDRWADLLAQMPGPTSTPLRSRSHHFRDQP